MENDRVLLIMRRQYSLISRTQALEVGMTSSAVRNRLRNGEWQPVATGVYRASSSAHANTWPERLAAACLQGGPGTVASHASAGHLWNLDRFNGRRPQPPEVLIPHGRSLDVEGVRVHETRQPVLQWAKRLDIPCTNLPRTLVDLAVTHPKDLESALDSALRFRSSWRRWIRSETQKLPGKHPGKQRLLKLLDERDFTFDSEPELTVKDLLWSAGLPRPRVHHVISDGALRIANVDFCWPELMLIVQVHGLASHLRAERFRLDQWQLSQLSARGWTLLVTTWHEISTHPVGFVTNTQRAYLRLCTERGIEPRLVLSAPPPCPSSPK